MLQCLSPPCVMFVHGTMDHIGTCHQKARMWHADFLKGIKAENKKIRAFSWIPIPLGRQRGKEDMFSTLFLRSQ